MNYLSLFNGVSAGRLALDRLQVPVRGYYVSEIDKYANSVTTQHYPDAVHLGSVTEFNSWDIDWSSIDLVTAGFPCQSWSLAGKQLGDKDPRGALFWTTLSIIKKVLQHNPNAKWMLENVKMKQEFEQYITHHTESELGEVHKVLINSNVFVPQSRERWYWTNFYVPEPALTLAKPPLLDVVLDAPFDRPCVERAKYQQSSTGCTHRSTATDIKGLDSLLRVYSVQGCAPTLTTCQGGHRQVKVTKDGVTYRKLLPVEYARLQGFPDGWCEDTLSNSQSYKCYGNAWTVPVIKYILGCLK